jgi:hypothetical protein
MFSFNVYAKEIIMSCGDSIFMYKSIVGIKSIKIRGEGGEWKKWGDKKKGDERKKPSGKFFNDVTLKIFDRGGVAKLIFLHTELPQNVIEVLGGKPNQQILWNGKVELDFIFFKIKNTMYYSYLDGSAIKKGLKEYDKNTPRVQEEECKKYSNE